MKKLILIAALMLAGNAVASVGGPGATWLTVRNNIDDGNLIIMNPDPGANAILGWDASSTWMRIDGGTGSPQFYTAGSGISMTGGVLSVIGKQNTITTGTTGQYLKGDLSLGTFPTLVSTFINDAGYATTTQLATKLTIPAGSATTQYVAGDGSIRSNVSIPVVNSWSQGPVSRSIVTGTGATGFQVSASRWASVNYSVSTTTTATIGGSSDGYVALEIAPTNSATPGDWVECSRSGNAQTITLAIVLQSAQKATAPVGCNVPPGYYAKLRSVNVSGTPTYAYNSGQETLTQ